MMYINIEMTLKHNVQVINSAQIEKLQIDYCSENIFLCVLQVAWMGNCLNWNLNGSRDISVIKLCH